MLENHDANEIVTMQKIAASAAARVVCRIPWLCADDLKQAALLEMLPRLDSWDGSGSFVAYLWPVAKSACAREARRRMIPVSGDCWRVGPMQGLRGVELTELNEAVTQPAQEQVTGRRAVIAKVRARILAVLRREDAVLILAMHAGELSAEDAAYAWDSTPNAIRARSYRIRKLLRADPVLLQLWEQS